MTISHQVENINKEMGIIKQEPNENPRDKHKTTEVKNSLEELNSTFELAEERISKCRQRLCIQKNKQKNE